MKSALDLATRLVNIADALAQDRMVQISNETLRTLKEEVSHSRMQISAGDFDIDYEASCLVDCMAALAYARTDGDKRREQRALMYLNSLRTFVRMDVNDANRRSDA